MEMSNLTPREEITQLADAMYCGMFASRETILEAMDYVYSFNQPEVTTAVMVVLNTLSIEIKRILGRI